MPAAIALFSNQTGSLKISGARPNDSAHVETIIIATAAGSGEIHCKLVLDPRLVTGEPAAPALRKWSDLQSQILRDALIAALSQIKLRVGGADATFLGAAGLPFSAAADCAGELTIDPITFEKSADSVFLKFSFSAHGDVQFGAAHATAHVAFSISVTANGAVGLLPELSVNGPNLAPLRLTWPRMDWPSLDWTRLTLPGLSRALALDVTIPGLPVHFVWRGPEPAFVLALDTQHNLTLRTAAGQSYNGDIRLDAGGAAQPLMSLDGFQFGWDANGVSVNGRVVTPAASVEIPPSTFGLTAVSPFRIETSAATLSLSALRVDLPGWTAGPIVNTLEIARFVIRCKNDPGLFLAFHVVYALTYDPATGAAAARLDRLDVIEPAPTALLTLATARAEDIAASLLRVTTALRLPHPDFPDFDALKRIFERVADMMAAAARWAAPAGGGELGTALLGVAEAAGEALANFVRWIGEELSAAQIAAGNAPAHLAIEARLDARTYALRQIVVSPAWTAPPDKDRNGRDLSAGGEALGLSLAMSFGWRPMLALDLDGAPSVALLVIPPDVNAAVTVGTDLWLSHGGDAGPTSVEAVRDAASDGARPSPRLIALALQLKRPGEAIALVRVASGGAQWLQLCTGAVATNPFAPGGGLPGDLKVTTISGPLQYAALNWANDVNGKLTIQKDRLLPFLQSSTGVGDTLLKSLNQYITVEANDATQLESNRNGVLEIPLKVALHISGTTVEFVIKLSLDLRVLRFSVSGGEKVDIEQDLPEIDFSPFGMQGRLIGKPDNGKYKILTLKFGGDVSLSLATGARLELAYGRIVSGGRGLVFLVDELTISRGGLDLDARADRETPVQLAGVDMPFRFDGAALSVKHSEIQAFSIQGAGQLPPELVGEANAKIVITMGRGSDGSLIVQSASADLQKPGDPIVCHATRFVLTLTSIGLELRDFASEGAGYHFFFTLTGTAEFRPREGEFTDGLLKNFGGIVIVLDKAPLARDASLLARAISFQIIVSPPKVFNLFNLFSFELRGFGFHPSSPAFDGKPAVGISGQVNFVKGTVIDPHFDFQMMWIGLPKPAQSLPQIRFDGLTVGIRFAGQVSIEGTAAAVDDTLPTLYAPGVLPKDVTARGFLASGKLSIKGWGAMAASMGFLELRKPGGDLRLAFFLYGEAIELSVEIPTPVGPIYLREFGFGFGFRFTLAAFNEADKVTSVASLIQVLDRISAYQGDLASLKSWEPEPEGDRVTLALRGMISINSASQGGPYNEKAEKELANPVLFDIVAALRSDLTFFLNARVWIVRNYGDWRSSGPNEPWRTNPTLRGYLYISVPRQEFLGRFVADGKGDVEGKHPELPAPIIKAMKGVRWSSTTYIRPGLFQQEFGWPYELGFTFEEKQGGGAFQIACEGGMITRIEDGALLYGIAFRARGYAQLGGSIGGGSFGASAVARADFAIDAKFIAYISIARFSDTLFYGSVAFDVTVSLQVRIWLEIDLGFTDLHLEVGFSLSLSISVALEVAVTPNSLAGRGSASVAVGAFGRTIRLGVAFAIDPGRLDEARSRVARFLQMGLTAALPDAEQGVAPPTAEGPRKASVSNADSTADNAAATKDKVHPQDKRPSGAERPVIGRALQPTAYWAMLFPVSGGTGAPEDEYVMIFVPRDHTWTGVDENELPVRTAGGAFGTFYPPPNAVEGAPSVALNMVGLDLPGPVTMRRLDPKQPNDARQDVTLRPGVALPLVYDTAQPVAEKFKLGGFLWQCFVGGAKAKVVGDLTEPLETPIEAGSLRLPGDREAAAQVLAQASRDRRSLGAELAKAHEIEERRSAAIAAFCDSAYKLAAGGAAALGAPVAATSFDIRSLGLAFVVKESDIDQLFAKADRHGDDDGPRRACFTLRSVIGAIVPFDHNVHLFNPPERMFRRRGPRLANPVLEARPGGLRLDWELEPPFALAPGVWSDPEFSLKHYRIERTITTSEGGPTSARPMRTTVKAAAPLKLPDTLPAVGEPIAWRSVRPNAQFVDDLSDLPEDMRFAILPPANEAEARGRKPATDAYVVRYTVVPVDVAGTDGPPTPLALRTRPFVPARAAIKRAALHFEYRGDPDPAIDAVTSTNGAPPTLLIGVDDGDQDAAERPTARYLLRVRPEAAAPIGLYGSDAVTQAKARPSAAEFALKRAGDRDFVIDFAPPAAAPQDDAPYRSFDQPAPLSGAASPGAYSLKDWKGLLSAVGADPAYPDRLDHGPSAVRFAIRPLDDAQAKSPDDATLWTPMDVTVLFGRAASAQQASRPAPIAAPVDVFEHPVRIDAAPLNMEDLDGDAGRVVVLRPQVFGHIGLVLPTLANLLNGPSPDLKLARTRDGARRVGTLLKWNAQPASADAALATASASSNARYFGGYDIFELDAAGEAEGATSAPTALALSFSFSASTAGGDPGRSLRLDLTRRVVLVGGDARLDALSDAGAIDGMSLQLIANRDPARAIDLKVESYVRVRGYRRLEIATRGQAKFDFRDGETVTMFLTSDPPARPIARVQALPAALARLDPAEIADFAKVEAQYPSESLRLGASSAGRQTPWYSAAESFVVWPGRTLRRTLSLNVDDTLLAEIFANGKPAYVQIGLKIGDGSGPKPILALFSNQPDPALDNTFAPPRPDVLWATAKLRDALQLLIWDADHANDRFKSNPDLFQEAQVTLTAVDATKQIVLAQVQWIVDLDPPLHPLLADVIELARYNRLPDLAATDSNYRRYEPVREPLPTSNAKSVADWFDETPATRDPYGWSILRSLGLAAGLKLYDTERREYCAAGEALAQISRAFGYASRLYQRDKLGAPFVEVLTRAGGLISLASFDGGQRGVDETDIGTLLDSDALALMQISLRPTVDRFSPQVKKAVAYFALCVKGNPRRPNDSTLTVTVRIAQTDKPLIAEVIDLQSGLAKPPIVTLASALAPGADTPLGKMLDGVSPLSETKLNTDKPNGVEIAVLRVTRLLDDAAQGVGPTGLDADLGELIEIPCPRFITALAAGGPAGADPFGRFPDMSAARFGQLARSDVQSHPAVEDAVKTLKAYALRRFPKGWPDPESTLLERLPQWTERFIDYGPYQTPQPLDGPLFALAEVTRPDPWRVGVVEDGTMQVLFTHDDRKRRLKRYAVKPFGRYDSFVDALLREADPDHASEPARLGGAWTRAYARAADPVAAFAEGWRSRWFDVVLPRTEPVAPPALISAKRVTLVEGGLSRTFLEFAFARHIEEMLSEANIVAEGALSFESVAFGFLREFPMQAWADALQPGVNPTDPFGDWATRPAMELIQSDDQFGGLAGTLAAPGRYSDGWRGALALRVEALPFFFRTHVAAYASAGVVVSDPVVATVEEGAYELRLPWKVDATVPAPIRTPAPTWSVARVGPDRGADAGLWVQFTLPLARLFDSMPANSRAIWLDGRPIPDVFLLPDPQARYEIAAIADAGGPKAISVELDLAPLRTPGSAPFVANVVGPLFAKTAMPKLDHEGQRWALTASARVAKPAAAALSTDFVPLIVAASGAVTDALQLFQVAAGAFDVWSKVAPATTAQITVHPPDPRNWNAFQVDVQNWRDLYAPYALKSAAADKIERFLTAWIGAPPAPPPAALLVVDDFLAGLPRLQPASPFVDLVQTTSWTWRKPDELGVAYRRAVRQVEASAAAANYSRDAFAEGVRTPIVAEMRRVKAALDETQARFEGYPPYVAALSEALSGAAAALAASADLPDCFDVLFETPIALANPEPADGDERVYRLMQAVERATFTAMAALDLARLEDLAAGDALGGAHVVAYFPHRALAAVSRALDDVDANARAAARPTALRLRQAPTDADRANILQEIRALADPQKTNLETFVENALATQIFGEGRKPQIKIYRGVSTPRSDDIARKG